MLATFGVALALSVGSEVRATESVRPTPFPSAVDALSSLQCKLDVLRSLGWQVNFAGTDAKIRVESPTVCQAGNKAQVPRLILPEPSPKNQLELLRAVGLVLRGRPNNCAFSKFFSQAALRSASRLQANQNYGFPMLGPPNTVARVPAWHAVDCKGGRNCAEPGEDVGSAIASLYSAHFTAECATGLQLAQYAAAYELFDELE